MYGPNQILNSWPVVFALVACAYVPSASAQVTNIEVVSQAAPAELLPGFIVNDIFIDFTGQYDGSMMRVSLESGMLYQHPAGSAAAPIAGVVAAFPDLAYDTFVAQGFAATDGSNAQSTQVGGGAVTLGGPPAAQFDSQGINQHWSTAGGVMIVDQTDFLVARLTLSADANGTVIYRGHAGSIAPADEIVLDAPIVGGVIGGVAIPEPSALVLAAIALVAISCVAQEQRRLSRKWDRHRSS